MWRLGVVRSELLHAAASLLQAVGLVLAVRLRLPRGGVVGVPGSAAEHRHYRGAVGWLAQLMPLFLHTLRHNPTVGVVSAWTWRLFQ